MKKKEFWKYLQGELRIIKKGLPDVMPDDLAFLSIILRELAHINSVRYIKDMKC